MPSVTVSGAHGSGQYVVVTYDTLAYRTLAEKLLATEQLYPDTGGQLVSTGGPVTISGGSPVIGVGPAGNTAGTGIGAVSLLDTSGVTNQLILSGNGTDLTFDATHGGGTVVAGDGTGNYSFESGNWNLNNTPDSVVGGLATGAGGTTVTAGSGFDVFAAGTGDAIVDGGSGTLFAFSSTGTTYYGLGVGDSYIVGGDGTSSIVGGAGTTTVAGSSGSNIVFTGASDTNFLIAGSGNETLNSSGATGANLLYAGSGDDSISAGGGGNDILFGGTGNATMTGGSGQDIFAFVDQAGGSTSADTVNDFTSSDFFMLIDGLNISSEDASSGSLVVTLTDNTQITFTGVTSIASDQIVT